MEKVIIESFTLDHTKVKAPYVRKISEEKGPKGDIVTNFDVRLTQPNLLALYLRPRIPGYLDCSPFGCRTGFHLLCWGSHNAHDVAVALKEALQLVLTTNWEDVPATTAKECGNYRDHSLFCAKEWAQQVLDQGISEDPYVRKIV